MDTRELALESARDLGVDMAVNPSSQSVADIVLSETWGVGADVVLEVAGVPEYYQQASNFRLSIPFLCTHSKSSHGIASRSGGGDGGYEVDG